MIYATVNVTVGEYESVCDKLITLYRGDKNVEIRFVLHGNRFTVLDSTYAQMIIKRPSSRSIFSEPALIQNDTVVFVITEDMIDELKEIGVYTFQIRLYDDTMTARATLPPCYSALTIEKPIAVEGESAVNLAMVNDSVVMLADTTTPEEETFTEDNKYNKTIWVDGDLITDTRLNKIEDALYYINEKGGGGGGGATAPYISTELPETVMVGSGENFDLHLYFNSPNMGKGTLRLFVNDVDIMSIKIDQGDSTTIVPSDLFAKGTNRVVVYVLDRVGIMSNSLVFYIRYGSTEISSDFDPYNAYDYGATIRYYFTPTALDTSLSLTFYMSIDGKIQKGVNCTSDTRGYYTFPTNLSADSHYCEAYVIDSEGVKSNVLSFNLIILDSNTLVVASDTKEVSVEEGAQVSLDYKVYMKYNTSFIANIYVDDVLVNTGTCNADFNYYKTSSLTKGVHTVKLEVFDVTKTHSDYITWTVTVLESTYEMLQPVNAGAMFIGTAINKSNTDERKQYFIGHDQEGNEVLGTLSNFAYNSESGWVNDELIISGNSHVEIPIKPLANNAKYGFTLDIEFTSKQIGVPDAEVLTLWNDETNCGIKITTEKLILQSSNGNKCDLYFTDNERTHVMFVIDRQELKAKIYLNGVMCEAFHLNDYTVEGVAYLDDFTVNSNIILGGLNTNGYCKIRNLRVYQVALTTDEIMNNFISCEIDKAKQRALSEFQKGNDLPTLYVYCDFSGLGKDDKKPCKIVYNSTNEELYGKSFNLDHKQSQLQYQGTSSMAYPIKNYRLNLRDENGDKWYYTLPTAQPECRFTLKADFMSSGHWTNTGMAKFINDKLYNYKVNDEKSMNPFKWDHVQNGGKVTDFRETISGFPCRLILVNDGETPLNTGQNEPTPGNTKDMGIFNFNNDKDNVTTLGFNSDIFPNCASYEVTANSDTSAGAFISYVKSKNIFKHENAFNGYIVSGKNTPCEIQTYNGEKVYCAGGSTPENSTFKIRNCFKENTVYTLQFNHIVPDSVEWAMVYIRYTDGETHSLNYKGVIEPTITSKVDKTIEQIYFINSQTCYIYADSILLLEGEIPEEGGAEELAYLKESFELRHPDEDDVAEDWGFMGVETEIPQYSVDYMYSSTFKNTTYISTDFFDSDTLTVKTIDDSNWQISYADTNGVWKANSSTAKSGESLTIDKSYPVMSIVDRTGYVTPPKLSININGFDYTYGNDLNGSKEIKDPYLNGETIKGWSDKHGLKALIDWVDNCTDEEFIRDFEEHFHKDYTLRYFCLVTLIGAVDNLGKNMMLDTADNKIYFPRFYDIDTICSYDNSGQLKFDVDIEMEQGYWNTSSSRLWTRIRDLMHDDIVTTYNDMRQNGVSYENMMHYIYDEQIAKIPQTYYNKDYDVKYAPFADSYIGMAHGDTYEHVKRWLKQRFAFVDTLFDYAPSYNNDILTIRVNTTEEITLHLETYTPVYQHLSWYNGQMDKKKIDGKTSITFSGKAQAATDQEVLIYGGSNIKKITGIQSGNPNRLILGSATKLTELDASNCPLLSEINMNKANLSPHEYLNKVNLSNCPLLEGNLRLNNSPLIQELDIRGTKITGMNLPSSIRNLQVLKLPNTMTELTLNDAGMLHTLEFDEGVKMQSIAMTNCNALTNVVNFDLLQTPSITLNNSYNTAAELYFRDTTNLSLSNMSNLERVIFTPNNEHETFELINVVNAPNYKVTTFNCPKLSTFMTTAPYRESYNNCGMRDKVIEEVEEVDLLEGEQHQTGIIDANTGEFLENTGTIIFNNYLKVVPNSDYIIQSPAQVRLGVYDKDKTFLSRHEINSFPNTFTIPSGGEYIRVSVYSSSLSEECSVIGKKIISETIQVKDYGNIQPNTTFTANSIDISNTQFTDVKLLCTTDTNTLKLPTTVKNFYCDSSFDLDTDYLEDGEYDVVHGELVEPYTTDYEGEVNRFSTLDKQIVLDNVSWEIYKSIDAITGELVYSNRAQTSEYIAVLGGSTFYTNGELYGYAQYDKNKELLTVNNYTSGGSTVTLQSSTAYIRFMLYPTTASTFDVKYTSIDAYTPNLIPSSSDGSLIFSMYAPNNAVAPASGTWDLKGLEFDNFHTFGMNNDVIQDSEGNITMPARYDDYNITIKNAHISPKTHNTMLYPLLVNEDNPITGTLDYTNYAGKHLSWSFAYTDEEYVNIIQPKDELLNSYEYRYNAFYDTEYEFDNPYEIARYTSNASGVLPSFNDKFTYTYDEINNGDGTYTTKIYADDLDNLPTSIKFDQMYNNDLRLLTVDKLKITSNITDMQYMFRNNRALTYVNTDGWDTSNVISMNQVFYNCMKLTSLDASNFNTDNVTDMAGMFQSCSALTSLDISNFNTSKVAYMNSMFQSCSALTSLDISRFDTGEVTNMASMFHGCSGLTSLDVSGFDTSNVTNMASMFHGCSGLTSLDVSGFDTSNVTDMSGMFYNCWSLKEVKGIENWDCSKVAKFGSMFQGATAFGGDLDLRNWKVGQNTTVTEIFGFMNGCANLKSVDMSGWVLPDKINFANFMSNQGSLHTVRVIGWSAKNIQNICGAIGTYVGGTIYGDVIIDETYLQNDWVYDNALIIAKYTASATGVLPGFNAEFTSCTTEETDNGDGTYTTKVYANSLDNLPTKINFTSNSNLLTVDKLNTSKVTTMFQMFRSCVNLTRINCRLDTSSVTNEVSQAFMDCINLEYLDITGFINSNIKYAVSLFQGCEAITHIVGLDTWDISSITDFSYMFANCYALSDLTAVENWDMSNAKVLDNIFARCHAIESFDLTKWDVRNVTNMRYMFGWARGPVSIDMTGWDTSNVTDMYYMFGFCNKLTEIKGLENFNTAKVTNMQFMLADYQGTELNLSNWDVSNVTNMGHLFEGCLNLQSLNISGWKTSNVTNMQGMFINCPSLTIITGLSDLDTSKVPDMSHMFNGCKKLTSINLSKWDASKVENMNKAFYNCSSITELNLSNFTNVKDWGSFCRNCTKLVSITGLDISKYSIGFGNSADNYLSFVGCTSLRNIKDLNVSFTSAMAKVNSISINNDYWMLCGWGWFNGLTNLVDITFTGQVELYDTMPVYYIFKGCDTTKFTHTTWNTFVSIFPTTSTSKSITLGGTQAILDAVPDEIKLALTQKGYTLTFRA